MRVIYALAVVLFGTMAMGCEAQNEVDPNLAAVDFALATTPDFAGNSVKICGTRVEPTAGTGNDPVTGPYAPKPADSKYACKNKVRQGTGDDCPCFDFKASNDTLGLVTDADKKYWELCSTDDYPNPAKWLFSYKIYGQSGCTGELLNNAGDSYNFVCYDSSDLFSRNFRNSSLELLPRGTLIHNKIICLTKNSAKDFDFDSCSDVSWQWYPTGPGTAFDCGWCAVQGTGENKTCNCSVDSTLLPTNCRADPTKNCVIVCNPS